MDWAADGQEPDLVNNGRHSRVAPFSDETVWRKAVDPTFFHFGPLSFEARRQLIRLKDKQFGTWLNIGLEQALDPAGNRPKSLLACLLSTLTALPRVKRVFSK